mgnify:CR=1 FL=1
MGAPLDTIIIGAGTAGLAALREVLTNPAAAERLRTAGLERARQFTWQAAAAAVLRVYGGAP